jgi:hypothetical protein
MIGLMRQPVEFQVRPVGPSGEPGALIVEGEKTRTMRIYRVPRVLSRNPNGPGYIATQSSGRSELIGPHNLLRFLRESPMEQLRDLASYDEQAADILRTAHAATEATLDEDVCKVQRFNAKVVATNNKIGSVLHEITGERLGGDPDAWTKWWNERIGYHYTRYETPAKPTRVTNVRVHVKLFSSCFAAGTPVLTLIGPRPIELLRVGDLVLSQDTQSGALSYQPIVEVHHNPPDATVQVRSSGETVVSTTYHRFWRPGRGWAMARDLKPGDFIRTLGGRTEVLSVETAPVQPVFNLDVARTCTFFVGSQYELVHDNSLPPAVLTPFDAEPSLASIAGEHPGLSQPHRDEIHPFVERKATSVPASGWDPGGTWPSHRRRSMLGPTME